MGRNMNFSDELFPFIKRDAPFPIDLGDIVYILCSSGPEKGQITKITLEAPDTRTRIEIALLNGKTRGAISAGRILTETEVIFYSLSTKHKEV